MSPVLGIAGQHARKQRASRDPRGTATIHTRRAVMILVDPIRRHPSGEWCHMVSHESVGELHEFAARIGLKRKAFQSTSRPHYDASIEAPAGCKHGSTRGRHEGSREEGATMIDALIDRTGA
jgi:hypothetical protein